MSARQNAVLDYVRERITGGMVPTYQEIADANGMTTAGAMYHVLRLEREGMIERRPKRARGLRLVGQVDLRTAPSEALRAELARRGETLQALQRPNLAFGRNSVSCAADSCQVRVRLGHLFCRQHWFSLSASLREEILQAFGTKDVERYQTLVAEARNAIDVGFYQAVDA